MIGTHNRFKIVRKDGRLTATARLDGKMAVNERELQVFRTKLIRGLMKPEVSGKKRIVYSAPDGIPILSYVRGGVSQNDFFFMMAQVIEVIKKIDRYHFNLNNLVLDYQYVFVNTRTREIYFIYQPMTILPYTSQSLFSFIQDIAYYMTLVPEGDSSAVTGFLNSLHQMRSFDPVEAEILLQRSCPDIYTKFRRSKTGQSDMLNDRRWGTGSGGISCSDDDEATTRLIDSDDEATTHLDEGAGAHPDWEATTSLDESGEAYTGEEYTTRLDENEEVYPPTALLKPQIQNYPYMIRLSSSERVDVDKPVFRIGKERSYVDYFVPDNGAVSRLHADIITERDGYSIRDNNSKNGTFVNGSFVAAEQQVRLYDGDRIVLANEEFEFHVD